MARGFGVLGFWGFGAGWTIIGGPATEVIAGSAGVFELDSSGNIWQYDGTPYQWTEIGGPGAEFAEGDGHLYGLGPSSNYIAEYNGTPNSWTIVGGPATWMWAGLDGLIAMAPYGTTQDVWRYNNTPNNWTDISVEGSFFAVGSGAIYRASGDYHTVSMWTGGTTWTPILTTTSDVEQIFANTAGVYIKTDDNVIGEQYFQYQGTPGDWSNIGTGPWVPAPAAESRTGLYGDTFDDNGVTAVDLYSGSGTTWTVIGGPADPRLAAGD